MSISRDPHYLAVNALLRKELAALHARQKPEREQFRASFILAAIGGGATMAYILARAKEAEDHVFGPLPEEGNDDAAR